MTALLAGFPVYWLLGFGTLIWVLAAGVMALLLKKQGGVRAPRGFGIWLMFLVWVTLSGTQLDSIGRVIGFGYRLALYLACTIIFLYVYNLRKKNLLDYLLNVLTVFFAVVVAGGYLGLLFPTLTIATPLSFVLPGWLLQNDLVREIVFVGTTQFNPDAWAYRDPRPSAPFLYTNNWGNAYSILLPLALVNLGKARRSRRFLPILVLCLLSFAPGFLTLNRGMFLGLGVIGLAVAFRYLVLGDVRGVLAVGTAGIIGALAYIVLPVAERLDTRLESSGSNESRMTVYTETISRTMESPFLGFGAPRPAEATGVPPAGTQGQVWMVLFSHGFVGIALFMAWFIFLAVRTWRRIDAAGIVIHGVIVGVTVELFYYGVLVHGLALVMIIAGAALQPSSLPDASSSRAGPLSGIRAPSQL